MVVVGGVVYAQRHIAHADERFTPGLQPDEMHHLVCRFLAQQDNATTGRKVDYRKFFDHYHRQINTVDQGGFLNIGQLPITATTKSTTEEEDVDIIASHLASMAERQMYSGGEALDPASYQQQRMAEETGTVAPPTGHDQTERLNRALLGAMLNRMGGTVEQALEKSIPLEFDPAILSEEELEQLMARRSR